MVCQITESPDCRTFKVEKLGYFVNARLMARTAREGHAPVDNFEMLKSRKGL